MRYLYSILLLAVMLLLMSDAFADECIEPISDRELFKLYKPCYGGWCLRK